MPKLTTVRRFRDLSEAIVARSLLEASGIVAYLCDENLVRLDWQVSNFIGGLRLQVELADEQDAIDLLNAPVPDDFSYTSDDSTYLQPRCPVCDSVEITFEGASRGAALASLYVFSLPLPFGSKTWVCSHCGHRWVDQPAQARIATDK